MQLAIVGCGYVADFYIKTLPLHPELQVVGVYDRDPAASERFASFYGVSRFDSFEQLLADSRVEIVLNLTNPTSHYEVNRACLEAGKHVYSEKPLTMRFEQSRELVELATQKGLELVCAPCSVLNEAAQTMWKALRENQVGTVRLVYAEMDDGMIHRMPLHSWGSPSGAPWPYEDEFKVGCTIEHAGYLVTWLVAFFGPARMVTAFSSVLVPDKGIRGPMPCDTPDFSVACLLFDSGVVARLTCGIMAPRDHTITAYGEEGVLWVHDCSHDRSPVRIRRYARIRKGRRLLPWSHTYPAVGRDNPKVPAQRSQNRDFARGIADMAQAIRDGRRPRLGADYSLHVNEIVLGIHYARQTGANQQLTTTVEPMEPMPYALQRPERVRSFAQTRPGAPTQPQGTER